MTGTGKRAAGGLPLGERLTRDQIEFLIRRGRRREGQAMGRAVAATLIRLTGRQCRLARPGSAAEPCGC